MLQRSPSDIVTKRVSIGKSLAFINSLLVTLDANSSSGVVDIEARTVIKTDLTLSKEDNCANIEGVMGLKLWSMNL